jgi:hypothetical protein
VVCKYLEVSKGTTRKLYITRVRFTKLKDVKVKEIGQIKISEYILAPTPLSAP